MLSVTYLSSATDLIGPARLVELLTAWRENNRTLDLTGMLLYSGGNFIQALEGPAGAVESLLATIGVDPRHRDLTVLQREQVQVRDYPDWSMGFRHVDPAEMQRVDGFNPFLQRRPWDEPDGGSNSTYRLMALFRKSMR